MDLNIYIVRCCFDPIFYCCIHYDTRTDVLTWSYGSWNYCYPWNQCLSPLMLWVRISIRARCTTLCDKICQWLATGQWFSPGIPVSSTNKTDQHDITEILLKVALNTIKQTNKQTNKHAFAFWTQLSLNGQHRLSNWICNACCRHRRPPHYANC